tara:strand:- start:194 stop:484 length:291 start_codon:yes stop_codon:yes gene_type:complete
MNRFNLTANDHLLASPADRLGRSFRAADSSSGLGASRIPSAPSQESADAQGADSEAQGGVRWDLIRRLRREIAAGTYASPERWQSAVNNLSDDLAG